MTRKLAILAAIVWTLIVTVLRALRLPNNFSKEHWLIDYRFGFVKRGLVGSIVSLATGAAHAQPTEGMINLLASVVFAAFCAVLVWVGLRMLRRTDWSGDMALAVLVFLSSPFVVMSAHLVGYYDNIVVMLAIASLACVFRRRLWIAAGLQSVSLLVHENTLLVALPAVAWAAWRADREHWSLRRLAPLFLPIALFALLAVRQSTAPHRLENSLNTYLSTYPFVASTLADVRVPHWITIGFYDSYLLHQGHVQERVLSQSMIALVLPSILALFGAIFTAGPIAAVSAESAALVAVCLLPQAMHVMVWDTARIWTYSILSAFLLLWTEAELGPRRRSTSDAVVFVSLAALLVNAITATPLMDGLKDRYDVMTRLWLYAPVMAGAVALARRDRVASGEPGPSVVT